MGDFLNSKKWQIVIHPAEEGGFWGEVPAMPGCASEGETEEECRANVLDAARGCLACYLETAIGRLASPVRGTMPVRHRRSRRLALAQA